MATTINAYNVSLGMDASSYLQQSSLSRSATNELKRTIESSRSPAENLEHAQRKLNAAYQAGAIDLPVYNRLLDAASEKHKTATNTLGSKVLKLGAAYLSYQALSSGIRTVIDTGVAFVNHLKDTQDAIDAVADASGKLGVSYNELIGLRFAAQEAGGVEASAVDAAIKKMQIAISKGSTAFAELGLDAGKLKAAGAVEAFSQIAEKISQVSNQADRLRLTTELLGKGGTELVSTLANGRDVIDKSVAFMTKFGSLTDAQVLAVQESNDAWDRVEAAVGGISNKLAAEAAPAMLLIAEYTLGTATNVENIDELLRTSVESAIGLAGWFKDLAELNPLGVIAGEAFEFGTAERMLTELYAKRAELEAEAIKEKFKTTKDIIDVDANATSEALEKESAANWEAFKERLKKEENAKIELERKLGREALKNAEEHFKHERENARRLRDDIAKGPTSIEAGSAEAAKYMAEQANAAIAASMGLDKAVPTEEELLVEAQRQSELLEKSQENEDRMVELLRGILDKKPEVGRIR